MSKQTAVQWLHYHLLHLMQTREWRSKDLHIEKFDELFIEALAMEREQIIDAFDEGQEYEYQYHVNGTPKFDSETYFIETYKGGEQ